MQRFVTATALVFAVLFAVPADAQTLYADTQLTVERYSSRSTSSTFDQYNPLAQLITAQFPQKQIQTVGQAIHQILSGSGYFQIHSPDQYAAALLHKPLPDIHRQLGPMPLATALKILIGHPYEITINEVKRELCVELKKAVNPGAMTPLDNALNRPAPLGSLENHVLQEETIPEQEVPNAIAVSDPGHGYVRR